MGKIKLALSITVFLLVLSLLGFGLGGMAPSVGGGYSSAKSDSIGIKGTATGRGATYVIAAPDAPAHVKKQADYVVSGTATDEINTAISALPDGGGKLLLSAGTFIYEGDRTIISRSGVVVEGMGASTIIDFTASNTQVFYIVAEGGDIYHVVFRNIKFVGSSRSSLAVFFVGSDSYTIYNSGVEDCYFDTPKGAAYLTYTNSSFFRRNIVSQDLSVECDGVGIAYGSHNSVTDNTFINIGDDAVSGYDTPCLQVTNNKILSSADSGVVLDYHVKEMGCPYSIVANNYIYDVRGGGTTPNSAAIAVCINAHHTIVSGNIIDTTTLADGIRIYRASYGLVIGNTISNIGLHGILGNQLVGWVISGNTITDPSQDKADTCSGICVTGGGASSAWYNQVTGNVISGPSALYDIHEFQGALGANYNSFVGNQVVSNGIKATGADTIVRDNRGWVEE